MADYPTDYIAHLGQSRETEAVETYLAQPFLRNHLNATLGLHEVLCWYAVRIPVTLIFPDADISRLPGDIDLMGGALRPGPAFANELEKAKSELPIGAHPDRIAELALMRTPPEWPPSLEFICAAEVKSCYLSAESTLKATKIGRIYDFHKQAKGLALIGFDRAMLMWITTTEPVLLENSADFSNWMEASLRASEASSKLERLLKADESQNFGQAILSLGSVPGGLEIHRGAPRVPKIIRESPDLSTTRDDKAQEFRSGLVSFLNGIFSSLPPMRQTQSFVMRVCAPAGCNQFFSTLPFQERKCPRCNRLAQ